MKKLMMTIAAAILFAALPLAADTYSDWRGNLKENRETTWVSVGRDTWSDSDEDKPLPYTFPCGAVLHHTPGGYRLDLINAVIGDSPVNSIVADGDLGICLIGENFVSGDICSSWGSLLIYGSGSLTIVDCYNGIKADRNISVCAGPSITISNAGTGIYAAEGPVLLSLCTVSMYDVSVGIKTSGDINILGSAVAISTDDATGISSGSDAATVIDGSMVSILSKHYCVSPLVSGDIFVTHSYFVGVSSGASVVWASNVSFDNCMAKFVSKDGNCIIADAVTIGEGDYYLATGSGIVYDTEFQHSLAAIEAEIIHLKGGNLQICAPKSIGIRADNLCQIDSGRLEMVDNINMRDLLVYNAALAVAYTGVLGSGTVDVSSLAMNFYTHDLMDALSDGRISDLEGTAWAGVFVPWEWSALSVIFEWEARRYVQNGGTVWCNKTPYGILAEDPIVNGGSCNSIFTQREYEMVLHDHEEPVYTNAPISVSGGMTNRNLKCVVHKVSGAKKYDKITSGFSGIVPSYYGTSSLYADSEGKLYFWIPGTDSGSGGSSGGSGSGGGSSGGGSGGSSGGSGDSGGSGGGATQQKIDLAFYTPSYWHQPMFVSTTVSNTTPRKISIEPGEPIYLMYSFYERASYTGVKDVVVRFRLNSGKTFDIKKTLRAGYSAGSGRAGVLLPELQNLPAGTYTLTCTLDATGAIKETREDNNTYSITFRIKAKADMKRDLAFVPYDDWPTAMFMTVRNAQGMPVVKTTTVPKGATAYVNFGFENLSPDGDEATGFSIERRLSNGDVVEDRNWRTGVLAGNELVTWQWVINTSDLPPGQYTATVTLDSRNELDETDESNNTLSISFTVIEVTYTVTFDANGGTVSPTTRQVKNITEVGTLPVPTRSGYKFLGWYTAESGGSTVSASTKVPANVTYYAHWKANDGGSSFTLSGTYVADKARTLAGAAFSGSAAVGVVSLKSGKAKKNGTFRISGTLTTLDGKKHAIKAFYATQGNGVLAISGITVRNYGTMTLRLAANGFTGTFSNGWTARTINVNSLPTGTLTFKCDPYPTSINGVSVKTAWLPLAQKVTSTGTKLTAPRAGRITYKNGDFKVNSDGQGNLSGLKLTYTARNGTFKGSFYVYTFNGKKLLRFTAKVTGVTVGGKGYAVVTVNRVRFPSQLKAMIER